MQEVGKVIRIIDNRSVLVNAGSNILDIGDKVKIYQVGEMIKDIDGSNLQEYVYVKDFLEVIDTEERYSVCQKKATRTKTLNLALTPLSKEITEHIPLTVDQNDIAPLNGFDPNVRIGDLVAVVD